ncbi:proline-rich protein 36 [Coregonus clupeaformis]|uniref:proline-rich protein 36 n=1 Tax=Coregonus clupeaformis TaxID=59861 RepID=UPI001E1C5626|nr:proline-rich protein 36 [Coregonus clupeaformis]
MSSSDIVQGFAVPTPKVPVLPSFNGPKINRAVNGDRFSNGSAISVPDLVEGEIFIPPPPTMAPPPPPPMFIPPPPDFLGDLDSIQPPSMPPPKPPSKPPSVVPSKEYEDFTSLKPPLMHPPKPPSTSSSASSSSLSISTPPPTTVPDFTEPPKFAPPQPPTDMRQAALKALKTPPPKPTRLSSIHSIDEPPQFPAPASLAQIPTPSSFNPQNTAKLYSVPKTGILGRQVDCDNRPKQILLLQVNGKAPSVAPPAKPARRNSSGMQLEQDLQDLKENLQATLPGQPTPPKTWEEVKVEPLPLSAQQGINKPAATPPKMSPKLQKVVTASVITEASQVKQEASPGRNRKFSPMLDHKLRNLKASEVTGMREGPSASPLALLMAAKEREKHRSTLSLENSTKSNEPSTSIQHSESNPNSFTVIPRSTSFTSVTSQDKPQSVVPLVIQTPAKPQIIESVVKGPIANPVVQRILPTSRSSSSSSLAVEKQSGEQRTPSPSSLVRDEENREDLCMPLLPPPPEFDDHDDVVDSPPSSPPPDPPVKKVLPPTPSPVLPVQSPTATPVKTPSPLPPPPPPPPPPKPKSQSPPKFPPPVMEIKPKLPVQTKPKPPPTQGLSSLSASQATLQSILQKKMLEMDRKMDNKMLAMKETDSDDWGSPLSDEETKVPVVLRVTPKNPVITAKSKSATMPAKTQGLDMKELETKMAMKAQSLSAPSKVPTSNGPQSKQACGMTFMVQPGTKQPITVVSKGDS